MIKLKGGTASAMSAENPVLADRQPGFARTNNGEILKIGDGVTPWNDLPEVVGSNIVDFQTLIDIAHPVGSYYWSSNPTSPNVLFNGGGYN